MNGYEFESYGIFGNAISTTTTVNTNVQNCETALKEVETILSNDAVCQGPYKDEIVKELSGLSTTMTTVIDNNNAIISYLQETSKSYQATDNSASNLILNNVQNSNVNLRQQSTNGNVLLTDTPVTKVNGYNLTDDELAYLAYVAKREQGTVGGAKLELSLMANLYEKNKSKYSNVTDYVKNSGWFASNSTNNYQNPGQEYINEAKSVLNDGNRYLNTNVIEHDCLSDITSISTGSVNNRSDYVPGETVIKNRYGATYTFVGFAPDGGDPFGYIN